MPRAVIQIKKYAVDTEMIRWLVMFEYQDVNYSAMFFEIEQEECAIISLDELSKISNNLYDSNEFMQYDDGNEPITIDEVINNYYSNIDVFGHTWY